MLADRAAATAAREPSTAHIPDNAPASPDSDHQPATTIEANDEEFAEDAADGYETATDASSNASTSLASTVRDFNFENKRRYHKFKEGRYLLPNDDMEQEREDMKHAMVLHVCEGVLHNAPLDNPQKILDIGTGTGIWAIDMGDEYPEAEIIGLDLSPIQPSFVPPNVHFLVDDVEAEWLFPENSIDYIHVRNMAPAIKDWPKLLQQAYISLKPGGWIELQDMLFSFDCDDGTAGPDYTPRKVMELLKEAFEIFGVDINAAKKFPERAEAAGFVNQIHDVRKVPVGTWPKDPHYRKVGNYCRAVNYDALGSVTNVPFTKGLGWSSLEVEVFLIQVRKDLLNDSFHAYNYYHSYSAQKPLEERTYN
ncbi:Putative S-adenosyl-L-methionine-dependent methyltransferase superfamily [Colletotrichum destructivum]|uniref:S-adenosyl-L-methionine-dependent methyltransferase superfamily n=1 Tax=Colletotrichum destructivum TaxID=34406 RepID=A0AAX4ITX4_9PEZI|nr:Putative S-adenosyl-L-methionine-dependent methyltransferase superfamily [Colletotrichum destructivum]